MERTKRKAVNFDLDTVIMRRLKLYPDGYRMLKNAFKRLGFEHRQGSGYVSKDKLDSMQVERVIKAIFTELPWVAECVKKLDVTDIGRQHDLTVIARAFGHANDDDVDIMVST